MLRLTGLTESVAWFQNVTEHFVHAKWHCATEETYTYVNGGKFTSSKISKS